MLSVVETAYNNNHRHTYNKNMPLSKIKLPVCRDKLYNVNVQPLEMFRRVLYQIYHNTV